MTALTIVIPIHNEATILRNEVEGVLDAMSKGLPDIDFELLLIENGSRDSTLQIAQTLCDEHSVVRMIISPVASYGRALKEGILSARGLATVVFNIDFWDIAFLKNAIHVMESTNCDIVVGSKTMPGSGDERPLARRMLTLAFNLALRLLYGYRGTDTHGVKYFKTKVLADIIPVCATERELFDTELLLRAQRKGVAIEEIPVVCAEKRPSTSGFMRRVPRTISDLVTIFISIHKA